MTRNEKLAIIQSAAYARALGLTFTSWGAGEGRQLLPLAPRISSANDSSRIDQRALIGLLDDLSGLAIASKIEPEVGMSTVSLRIDFLQPGAGSDVIGHAKCEGIFGEMALIRGTATDQSGEIVAASTAWFHVGAYPGQSSNASQAVTPNAVALSFQELGASFETMLGAVREGSSHMLPAAAHLFGGADVPAMHGGAIGAMLATSCLDQLQREQRQDMALISLSISYLRAVQSTLRASSSVRRMGGRIAFIDTTLRSDDDSTVVATAECVCARIKNTGHR